MSGINDVVRGCVFEEMGVPVLCLALFSVHVCVCVSLFPDSVLSSLQNNLRCCFAVFVL